jgi:predicted amidohydrolase YtcJ
MLFTNATIITMNPTRDIITSGAIAIEDNRIAAVGKAADLLARYQDDQVIDVKASSFSPASSIHMFILRRPLFAAARTIWR